MASNDLAGNNYRKVTSLSVPKVITRFLHSVGKNDWVEAGEVMFDAALDHYSSPPGWQGSALAQTKFLAEQDEPTGRLRKLKIGLGMRGHWMPCVFNLPTYEYCSFTDRKYSTQCVCCYSEIAKASSSSGFNNPSCSTG
jgi:hypothetical protein